MRHTWTRVMIVLIAVGSFVTLSAQARDALPGTNPDRSESLVESMELLLPELDQELPGEDIPPPLSLTAAFLELDADQIATLIFLLQERKQASAPIVQQIAQLEHVLEELLHTPEPAPAVVGTLVLQIRARRFALHQLKQEFVESFELELDDEQFHKLRAARKAKALEPVVDALDTVGLI
jgi:hypothetical protein